MSEGSSKAARTKHFIVEKTAPLFNAKGFAGTSINDMMAATGLSKGSIYGNFQNKDEVALAAFDYNFGRVVSFLREKAAQRTGAINKLLIYPETYRNILKIPFLAAGCPILNTSTEADDTHPALREKAAAALALWKAAIEGQVKKGMASGEIRKNADPVQVSAILMSLIEGAVMQAKVTRKTAVLKVTMDYLESMIRGLAA